jgi:hypothetical protein
MSSAVQMKGAGFHSMVAALGELDGEEARDRVVAALPEPIGPAFRSGALTRVGWYPIGHYGLLHEVIQQTLGGGERRARDLGAKSTEIDTRGLLRYMLAITTPGLLVRHANRVFGSYIRGAAVRTEKQSANGYDVVFPNMTGVSRLVFAEWEGGISYLLELAGARGVSVRRRAPLPDESGTLTMLATWNAS